MKIEIPWAHKGKVTTLLLDPVNGAGKESGSLFHILIDRYYYGQVVKTARGCVCLPQKENRFTDEEKSIILQAIKDAEDPGESPTRGIPCVK